MSQPAITIISSDITSGALIPPVHKGFTCGQPNVNPAIEWAI